MKVANALLLPLLLLHLLPALAAANEQSTRTEHPGYMPNGWNATAKLNLNGTAGIRSLRASMTVPSIIRQNNVLNNMSLFVGIYMQPTFKGIAPVAAGTLLSWNGEGWKARVAHQSSASNSKSGFVYWTHELDVGANDVVVTTIGLAYREEALDYTTSVVRASDNTTTNATEHVFLINNRRVSGFLAGIYLPGTAECSQISTSAMASIVIEKYEPLHEDTSNSSRWVLYPTTDKPVETLNKCRSLFLADVQNETSFNITARLRYTSPPAP